MRQKQRPERATQNRVIERITRCVVQKSQGGLGRAYWGEWSQREGRRCMGYVGALAKAA